MTGVQTCALPILSQDDEFYSEDSIMQIIESFGEELIATAKRVALIDGKPVEFPAESDRKKIGKKDFYNFMIINGNIMSGASTYYKKEVFEKIGYFDEQYKLLEDYPYYLKYLRLGNKIKFIDINVIKYSNDGISNSKIMNPILRNDFFKVFIEEQKYSEGYIKKYLKYQEHNYKNRIKSEKKLRDVIISYTKYLDFKIFKIFNKIFKKNILLKIYGLDN